MLYQSHHFLFCSFLSSSDIYREPHMFRKHRQYFPSNRSIDSNVWLFSMSPSPPPSPSFSHILPYQLSLDVAVKAAQEYFNSAAGPRDPEIELTRYSSSIIIKNGILYLTQLTHPPNYCTSTWLQ